MIIIVTSVKSIYLNKKVKKYKKKVQNCIIVLTI